MIKIEVDDSHYLEIRDAGFPAGREFDIKIGAVTIRMSAEKITELYREIEQTMWAEEEWSDNLRDKVEELEEKLSECESTIEELEDELESDKDYISNSYFM